MNDYYHKYIKYKTKYFEIKYGAGTPEKPKQTSTSPETPNKPYVLSTPTSTITKCSTPRKDIEPAILTRLIEKKDELICLLSANPNLSKYEIEARPKIKDTKPQLYINFERTVKGKKRDFAHLSFHYPSDEPEVKSDEDMFRPEALRIEDMFVPCTFHLRLDIDRSIIFNLVLENDNYKLISKTDDCEIIKKIGDTDFNDVKEIIACFEEIFNNTQYKKMFKEPIVKVLFSP
jgi:hypothetical protein